MKKRLLSLLLAIVMVVSVLPAALFAADETVVSFNDIQYRYYENNALYWAGKGVISGDGSGAFKGEDPATRAETAKILCLVMGFSVSKTAGAEFYGTFKDVVKNAWYVGYLEALYNRGVMLGDGAGKIRPDAKISRQEMGTLICRAMGIEEDTAPLNSSKLKGIDKIASWARGSMGALIGMGALKGDNNGNINAENNIKRGELVTLMSNLVTLYVEDSGTYDLTGKSGIVIVKASPVTLNGTFDGNVIFAEGITNAKHTVNADVSGKVISYGEKAFITVNGNTASVDAEGKSSVVNLNAPTSYFQLGGDSSSANVGADVEEVAVTGSDCTVNITGVKVALVGIQGNNDTVTTLGVTDELVVAKDADGAKVNVQIGGEVKNAKVDGNNATLSGSGALGSATVNGSYNAINTSNTNYYLGAAATNVTAGGKTVEPGTTGKTGGASVTVFGGGTSGSVDVTPQTIAPVITVQPQNIDEPLSFGSAYGKFSVEVKNEAKHTYRYQWYLADSASYDNGVAIDGATDAEISVSKQTPVGNYYIYCKVTASMSGAVTTKETLSEFATFSVQPGTVNVLLVGGQPELGTNKAMANALEALYQEQGITPNIVNTVTMSTTDMRMYSIFSWASTAMKGPSTGSTYGAIYNNIHTALAPDADVKYDYVIFALGRTWNLASRQVQSKTKEKLSLIYFEKLVYDHNPDATMFVASTAGFNIKNIACVDIGRTYGIAPDRAAHMSAQNAQAKEFVDILNDNSVPLDVQHLELGYGGELAMQAGVPTVDASAYKNVTLNGALVYAMIIFAKTTGLSPLDVTLTKWGSNEVSVNDMPVLTSSAAEAVSKSDTEYTVTFDSAGGTPVEPVKGKYGDKVQKPASPTNGDYTFGGWYKDDVYEESFDFARDTIGLCGMTLYAKWVGTSTVEPVITAQPANTVIRYATSGSISVDNEVAPHHTYSYQWYVSDDNDTSNGTEIRGATEKTLSFGRQYDLDLDKYYYCEVTASLAGSEDGSKSVLSTPANIKVEKGKLNILLIGGYDAFALTRNSDYLLADLFNDQGINATVTKVFSSDTSNSRVDMIFAWEGSGTNVYVSGYSKTSPYATFANNFATALSPKASQKYDYVICAVGRTWNLIKGQNTYIEREAKALERIEEMLYEHNPNGVMIIAPVAGFNVDEPFGYNSSSVFKKQSEDTIKYAIANGRTDHVNIMDARADTLKDRLDDNDVATEVDVCRIGRAMELTIDKGESLYASGYNNYHSNAGAYVFSSTLYSYISKFDVDTITATTWQGGLSVAETTVNSAKDAVHETVFGSKAEYTVTFDTCGGSEIASFKVAKDSRITKPEDPTHENVNYSFGGWYKDPEYNEEFNFYSDKMPLGGITLYALWKGMETKEPVITSQPKALALSYGKGGSLTFEHSVEEHHNYTYQWYVNTEENNTTGTAIEGATEKTLKLERQFEANTSYYYCVVTAAVKESANGALSVTTDPAKVTVEKKLNVLIVGGTPEFTLLNKSDVLLHDLLAEKGIESTVTKVFTKDAAHTNIYMLFTWTGSGTNVQISGDSSSGNYKTFVANLNAALDPAAELKYDYVICAVGRTWSLISGQTSYIERETKAFERIEEMVYAHNPDATMVIAATPGYNYNEPFGYNASSAFKTASQDTIKYLIANNRDDHTARISAKADTIKSRLDASETPLETVIWRFGSALDIAQNSGAVVALESYPHYYNTIGAYITAGYFTAMMTDADVNSWTTKTWDSNNYSITSEGLDYAKDAINEAISGKTAEYELAFDTMGGDAKTPVKYEKGAVIEKPADPTFNDRIFDGWYQDDGYEKECIFDDEFVMPVGGMTIYAKWMPEGYINVNYEYYLQKADGKTYELDETRSYSDHVMKGTSLSITVEDIEGYSVDTSAANNLSGVANVNGYTYKVYYARNKYTVSYEYDASAPGNAPNAPAPATAVFGSEVRVSTTIIKAKGYVFLGWKTDDVTVTDGAFTMPTKDVKFVGKWLPDNADKAVTGLNVNGKANGKGNSYFGNEIEVSGDLETGYTVTGTVYTSDNRATTKPYTIVLSFNDLIGTASVVATSESGKVEKTDNITGTGGALATFIETDKSVTLSVKSDSALPVDITVSLNVTFEDFNYVKPLADSTEAMTSENEISVYMICSPYMGLNDINDKISEVGSKMGYNVISSSNSYNSASSNTAELGLYEIMNMNGTNVLGWASSSRASTITSYIIGNKPDFLLVSTGRGPAITGESRDVKNINCYVFIEEWLKENSPDTKLVVIDDLPYPPTPAASSKTYTNDGTTLGHLKKLYAYYSQVYDNVESDRIIWLGGAFKMALDKELDVYITNDANANTKPTDLGAYLIAYNIMARLTGTKPVAVEDAHNGIVEVAAQATGLGD